MAVALTGLLTAAPVLSQQEGPVPDGLPDPAAQEGTDLVPEAVPDAAPVTVEDPVAVADSAPPAEDAPRPPPESLPDDPPVPASDPGAALVLPPICADAGVSAQDCLAVLAGFSFEAYCRLNDIPEAGCLDFISVYRMPATCVSADLTLPGCVDYLDRQTRLYREQVKGLIAQCEAGDAGICAAAEADLTELRDRLAEAEARSAGLEADLDGLRAENGTLTARAEAAQAALDAREVRPSDVCRAAAQRLNSRAAGALGDAAPALDEAACASNPIAVITRFLALLSAPDPAKAAEVLREGDPAAASPIDTPPETPTVPPVAPAGQGACVALPNEGDLGFFLIEQDALFGGLGPVRQNVLVNSLLRGDPAVEAVEKAWPKPLDDAERARADEAARLLCTTYPATCAAESGVEDCP